MMEGLLGRAFVVVLLHLVKRVDGVSRRETIESMDTQREGLQVTIMVGLLGREFVVMLLAQSRVSGLSGLTESVD